MRDKVLATVAVPLLATFAVGPSASTAAGPDSFGYVAHEVAYDFEDVSATGVRVLADHDDAVAQLALPFAFRFYGKPYDVVFVSTNGLLSFGGGTAAFANQPLGGWLSPDLALAAVLWDDWLTFGSAADAVHHETLGAPGARRFVVQWHVVQRYPGSPSTATFQAVLHEADGAIEYRYRDADTEDAGSAGASAAVGIRDAAAAENGRSLQWSHDAAVISDGSAIRFTSNRPPDCSDVAARPPTLWPPNHKLRTVTVGGVTDPDGDPVTVTVAGVTQDEPVDGSGAGDRSPDAVAGPAPEQVDLRAERSGTGDGRVYVVTVRGSDGKGGTCTGSATVGVPHSSPGGG